MRDSIKGAIKKSRLLSFIKANKKIIILLFLLNVISSLFFLIAPYFSKLFIDKAFINKDLAKFFNLSILGAIIFIFSTFFAVVKDVVKNRISIKFKLDLTNKFIRKFYSFDLSFFQQKAVGENVYRLSDTETVVNFFIEQCPQFLSSIVKLFIILGISLWLNNQMTIFLLILSPLFLIHRVYIQKKIKPIYEEIWRYSAKLYKEIYEAFSRILIIKVFGLESFQRRIYFDSLIKNLRWRVRSFRWSIISSLTSSFLSKAIYGLVTLYGGLLVINGRLSIGSYTAVMLYLTQLGGLLESLSNNFEYFARDAVSLGKFFEIIDMQPQIIDLPGARSLKFIKGEIELKDIYFGYESTKPIFEDLNFSIPASSWIGIVGPSGCGKTTLMNLILRLYEPWKGKIILDGIDLRTIKLSVLRERIAISTQQPFLFDVSIRENICYGLRGVSLDRIKEASKIACISDFIEQLPLGYYSLIGEDACRLSQGLKQRLAIARAILRNPDLLIFDEATSSIDSLTEEKIFQDLRRKRQGLSTIIISHRLFSIKYADRIYFLKENGQIEEGTHNELLSTSPGYRDLFHNQIENIE